MTLMVKNLPAMQETWVQSLGWEDPLEKGMATNSGILAWRIWCSCLSLGQRSLAGYSPLGRKESDMTEQLTLYRELNYNLVNILMLMFSSSVNLYKCT